MANSRYKYYNAFLRNITDFNDRKDAPLPNAKIQEAIHKVIAEEKFYDRKTTADIFSHTSNTQRDNANAILKSENQDKLEKLAEMLLDLTINNAEYYVLDSANSNDTKVDHEKKSEDSYSH